jgi:hypothetical protein
MAKKTYLLADGSTVTVDDTISLLGPNPNLAGTSAQDSARDLKHQPIKFWRADDTPSQLPKAPEGYGNPCDDPAFLQQWGTGPGTDGQPISDAGAANHPLNRRT